MEDEDGVDAARARPAGQALERREAHARVRAAPAADHAHARAAAEVRDDEAARRLRLAEVRGRVAQDARVREPVRAVLAQRDRRLFLRRLERVRVDVRREGRVEERVEAEDLCRIGQVFKAGWQCALARAVREGDASVQRTVVTERWFYGLYSIRFGRCTCSSHAAARTR